MNVVFMKKMKYLIVFFTMILLIVVQVAAQQLPAGINIDQLSDAQLMQYLGMANGAGLSEADLMVKAREKGLNDAQILQLKERLQGLNGNTAGAKQVADSAEYRKGVSIKSPQNQIQIINGLPVFGSELFAKDNLIFEPNLQIPTPKNYQLGVGDQLNIDLFGFSDVNFKLKVSPDGMIRIPNLGPVKVAGLNFDAAQEKIKVQLSKIYPQLSTGLTAIQMTLGNIRSIRVTLIGETQKPGTYTLSSLATIANALYVSGGPNTIGSYRNIELVRNGKTIAVFDLYRFLLKGDLSANLRLEDDDIIKVNAYQNRVILNGAVKRKAIYETKTEDDLNFLMQISGGFADQAFRDFIRVVRINQSQKEAIIVKKEDFGSFRFHTGDSLYVDSVYNRFSNQVVVIGAIYHPGTYSVSEFPGLKILLETAVLREEAYLKRGTIKRRGENYMQEMIDFNVKDVLNGTKIIPLQKEDSVHIFSVWELKSRDSVNLNGEVHKPGFFTFIPGMQLQDLILMAGGFKESASGKRIEISRRMKDSSVEDESTKYALVKVIELDKDLSSTKDAPQFLLEPFDIIAVRKNPVYKEQIKVRIEGEVLYPGEYTVESKTETVSDLIIRAGGLRTNAYPEGAVLLRNTFSDSIESRFAQTKMQSIQNQFTSDSLSKNLINSINQNRKIVGIRLNEAMENPHKRGDINLLEGDVLSVPEIPKTVQSFGAVYVPKKVLYTPGLSLKDVVEESGGYLNTASHRRTYVMYPNGEIRTIKHFLFFKSYPKIKPGSEVYVPLHIRKYTIAEVASVGAASASIAALFISMIYLIKSL